MNLYKMIILWIIMATPLFCIKQTKYSPAQVQQQLCLGWMIYAGISKAGEPDSMLMFCFPLFSLLLITSFVLLSLLIHSQRFQSNLIGLLVLVLGSTSHV